MISRFECKKYRINPMSSLIFFYRVYLFNESAEISELSDVLVVELVTAVFFAQRDDNAEKKLSIFLYFLVGYLKQRVLQHCRCQRANQTNRKALRAMTICTYLIFTIVQTTIYQLKGQFFNFE